MYAYAAAMGVAGGVLTVVFFTVWRQAFGPRHLGQIQGAAQLLTVLASAAGPLLLAAGQRAYGSYAPVVPEPRPRSPAVFAVAAWLVPLPDASAPPTGGRRMSDRHSTDPPTDRAGRLRPATGSSSSAALFDPDEMRRAPGRGRPPARPTATT